MAVGRYANQYFTTTLSVIGGIDSSQTTGIVIQATSGIQDTTKPGVALLNYADPLNETIAEWILFDSINSTTKEFVGVTRGAEKGSAKSHSNGVTVAFPFSESHINPLVDAVSINGSATNILTKIVGKGGSSSNNAVEGVTKEYVDEPTKTIVIPAGSMSPTTTAGCASVATVEAGTNDVDYKVLDFDKDTDESAFVVFAMPDGWDGSTITFRTIWTSAGTTGTVVWSLKGRAFANDDAIDQAYGTAQTSTDTFIASGDVHISPVSSALTLAGSPAGGQLVQLKITRDVSEDTLDADARLIAVILEYGLSAHSD